jgi:hypothetical protein
VPLDNLFWGSCPGLAARHNATSESEHSVRLRSLKGSSALAPAETGPWSVGKGQGPLRQNPSPFGAGYAKKTGPRDSGERCIMAFRFVLFFGCPSLHSHEPLYFPRAFELLASLSACGSLSHCSHFLCSSHHKILCTFACRSELLLLTTSLMGVNAAALSTDSAGQGLCWCDRIPCVGICLVCPH